jgi:hypothetical protein
MAADAETMRALAMAATPGPWMHDPTGGICGRRFAACVWGEAGPGHGAIVDAAPFSLRSEQNLADAAYIAAANPAAVLSLLDERDALRKVLIALLADTQHIMHNCSDPDCPVDLARAALRTLRDAATMENNT